MRSLAVPALILPAACAAQVTTSVTNGPWNDPVTWDCGCVPDSGVILVDHHVSVSGDLLFVADSVHIAAGASIWMPFSPTEAFVLIFGRVRNEGSISMHAHVDILDTGRVSGPGAIDIDGVFHNYGVYAPEADAPLHVFGDLVNEGIVIGDGAMCITNLTYNNGLISGVDLCDMTPSTTVPPIIDVNSGTVDADVTWCAEALCPVSVGETTVNRPDVWPVPAMDRVYIGPVVATSLTVHDPTGRSCPVRWSSMDEVVRIERGALPAGAYVLRVVDRSGRVYALPFILAEP